MRKLVLMGCLVSLIVSCTEKKTEEEPKIHIINSGSSQGGADQSVAIPMHGTKENSSSASGRRFESSQREPEKGQPTTQDSKVQEN